MRLEARLHKVLSVWLRLPGHDAEDDAGQQPRSGRPSGVKEMDEAWCASVDRRGVGEEMGQWGEAEMDNVASWVRASGASQTRSVERARHTPSLLCPCVPCYPPASFSGRVTYLADGWGLSGLDTSRVPQLSLTVITMSCQNLPGIFAGQQI